MTVSPGRTTSRALVVLLLLTYGLVLGSVGGVVTARLAGYPGFPGVAPARDVPKASDGVLAGVTSSGVQRAMTALGFSCARASSTSPSHSVVCQGERTAGYDISLTVESQADGRVTSLIGRCAQTSGAATVEGCRTFIDGVPTLLYPSNATAAKPAQDWVSQNLGADTTTVIGGVYYLLQLQPVGIACAPAA